MSSQLSAEARPRFVVDAMLGDLARWLRLLGYDTVYARGMPDSRIIRMAVEEGRIIVTRDRGLYIRAVRKGAKAVLVRGGDVAERLAFLHLKLGVRLYVDPDETRCPLCNGELARVSRDYVRGRVPPRIYELYSEFWVCQRCGQIYWRGGHWRGIEETLERARALALKSTRRGRGRSR